MDKLQDFINQNITFVEYKQSHVRTHRDGSAHVVHYFIVCVMESLTLNDEVVTNTIKDGQKLCGSQDSQRPPTSSFETIFFTRQSRHTNQYSIQLGSDKF